MDRPTFYTTVVRSPQWEAWYDHQVKAMEWDVAESQETGWISPEHFQAFMRFSKIVE